MRYGGVFVDLIHVKIPEIPIKAFKRSFSICQESVMEQNRKDERKKCKSVGTKIIGSFANNQVVSDAAQESVNLAKEINNETNIQQMMSQLWTKHVLGEGSEFYVAIL